jgi:hypothetical protein
MLAPRAVLLTVLILMYAASGSEVVAQGAPDARPRIAAQKEAMGRLAFLDGTWRGEATETRPTGTRTFTQTERVGPFLEGSVKVVEGRGYEADGTLVFNAFGIIAYDPDKKLYGMRTYAQGRGADVPVTVTADGFLWEIAVGPLTIRYTATVKDGTWHEVGERVTVGGGPVKFFEMTLKRIGDTDWPAAGAVPPK